MVENDINILLIEDHPGDARLVKEALLDSYYSNTSLFTASSIAEARRLASEKIILILLDLGLPDSRGLESISQVLSIFSDSALIVLTGLDDERVALEAFRLGVQNYLSKDEITPAVLTRTIRFSLERHEVIQKLKIAERELSLKNLQVEKSERKYRALIEYSNDLICLMDRNGKLLYVSPSHEPIMGWPLADRLSGKIEDTVHPDDKIVLEECFKKCLDSPAQAMPASFRSQHKDGRYLWLEGTFTNLLEEPDVMAIVTNMRDVTLRREAEQRIRESEDRLADAQAVAKLGSWETNLTTFSVIWSREIYRIFGLDPDRFQVTHSTFLDYVHPDDRKAVDDAFRASFEKFHFHSLEHRLLTSDGEIKWVEERWQVFRDHELKPFKASGTCQDITSRKLAEQQLQDEKILSDSIVNSLPGIFYFYDRHGRFYKWNKNMEVISGYAGREIQQMHPLDFFDHDEKELVRLKIETVFALGAADINAHILTKTGDRIPYYLNGHRITFKGKDYLIGVGIDMTERTRIEQELINYTEEIQHLTAYLDRVREEERARISREIHDVLGQQLTGMKMDASWIYKHAPEKDENLRKKISSMIALMDETVKTIRRISTELRPGILDDLGLVAALEWQSSEFQKRTEIACTFRSPDLELEIDKGKATGIFRIFQEALTNVMRHSQATRIEATLIQSDSELALMVSDNGVGFNVAEVKRKKTLGLIGMRERALILGGEIEIESVQNQGTQLKLRIPTTERAHDD